MSQNSFEEIYRQAGCYWGVEPHRYVKAVSNYKKSGTVLDLGVGEGRNGLYLAQKGFTVTGVDMSEAGVEKFKTLAGKFGVEVTGIVADMRTFDFAPYDIIISTATLHFLNLAEITGLIHKIKAHTAPSGFNVFSVFTEDNPGKQFAHLFRKNELKEFYQDWQIVRYQETLTAIEQHGPTGKPHRHAVAAIIAKKPKSSS